MSRAGYLKAEISGEKIKPTLIVLKNEDDLTLPTAAMPLRLVRLVYYRGL